MDYEVYAHERHHIFYTDAVFESEIRRLVTYIDRINHLDSLDLDCMIVYSMQLTVDDATVEIEDVAVVANGKSQYRLDKGFRNVTSTIWEDNSEIMRLLEKTRTAKEVTFDIDYWVDGPEFGRFGIAYWNSTSLGDFSGNSEHKIIEHNFNMNETLDMYAEDKNGIRWLSQGAFDSDAEHCEDVGSWYSQDFLLDMYAEKDWDNYPELRDEIMELLKDFASMYDPINEPGDPYEDQILLGDCPTVEKAELADFMNALQKVIDLAGQANAGIGFEGTFKSASGYPFAAMEVFLDDDYKVRTKYYRI